EDTETGLHYNWNRFYSPATGRYLTEDPLVSEVPGFGESVYGYARNNPTVYTDPDGRCPICIAAGIIVAEAIADLLVVGGTAAGVVAGTQVIDHYMNESRGDGGSCSESGSGAKAKQPSPRHTPDQEALVELAKKAKKTGGVTEDQAEQLLDWAKEVGLPGRGPEVHPDRNFDKPHIHVGPVDHILVR
ncbi:MAG: RHS repeat-associated core domain-containing protein, partial [Myxococcota bacterium]